MNATIKIEPNATTTNANPAGPMDSSVLLVLMALFAWWMYRRWKTRDIRAAKKRQRQWAIENSDPEVASNLRVILESIELFRTSKNPSTSRSRFDLAVERLNDLIRQRPYRDDWRELLQTLQEEGKRFLQEALAASIDRHVEKAALAKSVSTKISCLNKAILELSDAETSGEYNNKWLDAKRAEIEELIHQSEFGTLLEKAERHEFKEEWKKALSAYQDVLFFLKKDDIADEEQADLFADIEGKIAAMKNKLASDPASA